MCKLATKVERQLNESRKGGYRSTNPEQPFKGGSVHFKNKSVKASTTKISTKPEVSTAGSSRSSPTNVHRCFKCQVMGHIASDCPNQRIISLVEEEDGVTEVLDNPTFDEEIIEEEAVYADEGESLVVQRNLSSTHIEDNWLRNNIFHTRCTSHERVCNKSLTVKVVKM